MKPLGRPDRLRWLLVFSLALLVGSRPQAATNGSFWNPSIPCIQDPADPCQAAIGDTIDHLCAIVTGLDRTPPSFGLYFQNRASGANGAPYTGIGVNTANVDVAQSLGLTLGDSIIVSNGKIGDVGSERQLVPPGTAVVVTKVGATGTGPAYHLGSVSELQMYIDSTGASWRGCLVRVNAVMRVVKAAPSGRLQPNRFILVDNGPCPSGSAGPCDSLLVDGQTLRTPAFTPPALGKLVYMVRGVFGQSGNSCEVRLRDSTDIKVQGTTGVGDVVPAGLALTVLANPSRTLRVRFALPQSGEVDVAVYDLAGRRVATLAGGTLPQGIHDRDWNPRRSGDSSAGAGVYFVRLSAGAERRVARAVIVD